MSDRTPDLEWHSSASDSCSWASAREQDDAENDQVGRLYLSDAEALEHLQKHPHEPRPIHVTYGIDDPDNPRAWGHVRKYYVTCLVCTANVITYVTCTVSQLNVSSSAHLNAAVSWRVESLLALVPSV